NLIRHHAHMDGVRTDIAVGVDPEASVGLAHALDIDFQAAVGEQRPNAGDAAEDAPEAGATLCDPSGRPAHPANPADQAEIVLQPLKVSILAQDAVGILAVQLVLLL